MFNKGADQSDQKGKEEENDRIQSVVNDNASICRKYDRILDCIDS